MSKATVTAALNDNSAGEISASDVRTSVLEVGWPGGIDLAFGAKITASPDSQYTEIIFTRLLSADSDWSATNGSMLTWRGPDPEQHQAGWLGFDDGEAFTIVLDMGAAVDGTKLILTGHYGHDQISRPTGMKLERSSDGNTYGTVKDWGTSLTDGGANGAGVWAVIADISAESAYRYWRWTVTPDGSDWAFIGPMYFLR